MAGNSNSFQVIRFALRRSVISPSSSSRWAAEEVDRGFANAAQAIGDRFVGVGNSFSE